MTLTFEVPGRLVTANKRLTPIRRGPLGVSMLKTQAARIYQDRVSSIARAVALGARWQWPNRAAVRIDAYGYHLPDVGNCEKLLVDGMNKIIFEDDRCIDLLTVRRHAEKVARVTVRVRAL